MKHYVYWIYDNACASIETDGYVGVSKDPNHRFKVHKRKGRVSDSCEMKILYEGDRSSCFERERLLRPRPGIGWNNAIGGSHGWQYGFTHTETTRSKMKDAWTDERKEALRKRLPEHNKKMQGQKRSKQSKAISGKQNPMYGKTHTEDARKKISEANAGRSPWNKMESYCEICGERAAPSILKKYHGEGKKNCRNRT